MNHVNLFRGLQMETGALVSGSAVVQYLSRRQLSPSDLDIFVTKDYVLLIGRFLFQRGYVFSPMVTLMDGRKRLSEEQPLDFVEAVYDELIKAKPNTGEVADRYEVTEIAGVFNFVKATGGNGERVQVIATEGEPRFVFVFTNFRVSLALVMNIASATEVVSLYPWTSFVENRALYLKKDTRAVLSARRKYEDRGWASIDMLSAEQYLDRSSELSSVPRWVGDGRCWVLRFSSLCPALYMGTMKRSLALTSWSLSCRHPSFVAVSTARLDKAYLSRRYYVLSGAELAVRVHSCFAAFGESAPRIQVLPSVVDTEVGSTVEEDRAISQGSIAPGSRPGLVGSRDVVMSVASDDDGSDFSDAESAEVRAQLDPGQVEPVSRVRCSSSSGDDSMESDSTISASSDSSWDGLDVWRHTNGVRGCTHLVIGPKYPPDDAVFDYLRGFYPLLLEAHRRGRVLEKLRCAFRRAMYPCPSDDVVVQCPSAFVPASVLRCLTDVAWSGLWEEEEVDFHVAFAYDSSSRSIHTTCEFRVPEDHLDSVKKDVADWVVWTDDWSEGRVTFSVASVGSD
ncbi:hypothetical protein VNI00_013142 [Paramarasmius palmivorus]|uniref:Uncharacterized protein n=1 Tax=Paramarasmius palmivorus TaxID=297713 RepID=A0AAW0BZ71_9AGAR